MLATSDGIGEFEILGSFGGASVEHGERQEMMVDGESPRAGLDVADVVVSFGTGQPVITGASFEVAPQEVVALTGPSGSGKSTLLRAIAGLEPLEGGEIRWDGESLARVPTHRRGFGLVFQDGQLFSHRSVGENIAYGLRVQGVARAGREARVRELLALVGLSGAAARTVTELSGGERQRVALARSLAPRPRMLLLDEPLSALDRELRDRLAADLAVMLRETGTTAILVTHDIEEAEMVADRTLRIDGGKVEAR